MPGMVNGASDSYTPQSNGDLHHTPNARVPNGVHASETMSNLRDTDIAIVGMGKYISLLVQFKELKTPFKSVPITGQRG